MNTIHALILLLWGGFAMIAGQALIASARDHRQRVRNSLPVKPMPAQWARYTETSEIFTPWRVERAPLDLVLRAMRSEKAQRWLD